MLEWHAEIGQQWSIKFGPYGRRLKRHLRPDLWAELEDTYTRAGLEANWDALFRSIDLMRRVAAEVGEHLGFTYPQELEQRVVTYLAEGQRTRSKCNELQVKLAARSPGPAVRSRIHPTPPVPKTTIRIAFMTRLPGRSNCTTAVPHPKHRSRHSLQSSTTVAFPSCNR